MLKEVLKKPPFSYDVGPKTPTYGLRTHKNRRWGRNPNLLSGLLDVDKIFMFLVKYLYDYSL